MKTYSHDYTKVSDAENLLYFAQRLNAKGETTEALEYVADARQLLQEYLTQDNMIEDDDVADGWVKMSDIEKLGLLT